MLVLVDILTHKPRLLRQPMKSAWERVATHNGETHKAFERDTLQKLPYKEKRSRHEFLERLQDILTQQLKYIIFIETLASRKYLPVFTPEIQTTLSLWFALTT